MVRHSKGLRGSRSMRRASIECIVFLTMLMSAGLLWQRAFAEETESLGTTSAESSANIGKQMQNTPPPKGIPREPMEVLIALGPFLYPLGICSIVLVWFSLERMVILRRGRVIPRPFVKRFFEHLNEGKLDPKSALKLCEENGSPIASIFAHGIRKWGKGSVEVEQAIIDGGERQVSLFRKHLRIINGVATVSPLLGLLGTVVCMIESFNTIATKAAMGKSEELAAGIGLALLTTAAGLMIAIPALIIYMYLSGKVDALVIAMDGLAQTLVDTISAEGLNDQVRLAARAGASTKPSSEIRKPN